MAEETTKILIADDEPDVHEFLHVALEREGVTFVDAADGEEALIKAAEETPDLIILDVQMPKKDGFGVFAELQKQDTTQDTPVIMLTGVGERTGVGFSAEDMGQYLGKEPAAYIEKPVDPEKIRAVVDSLLQA